MYVDVGGAIYVLHCSTLFHSIICTDGLYKRLNSSSSNVDVSGAFYVLHCSIQLFALMVSING